METVQLTQRQFRIRVDKASLFVIDDRAGLSSSFDFDICFHLQDQIP